MTGTGNENDPYIISTWDDLNIELRNIINYADGSGYKNGTSDEQKAYIMLDNDIAMPSDTLDDFIPFDTTLAYINFDGHDHMIKNISNDRIDSALLYTGGIFTALTDSIIKNVRFRDINFYGNANYFGGLVGEVASCSFENIFISGSINILKYLSSTVGVSGFAGYIGGTGNYFNKCVSNCNITSVDRGYGFAGSASNTQLTNCKSVCTFSVTNIAGGFCASGCSLYNCEAACRYKKAGEIQFLGTGSNCVCSYSHSAIDDDVTLAANKIRVFGRSSSSTVKYTYYDSDILDDREITVDTGTEGVTTAQLKNSSWLIEHGFLM